MKNLLTSVFLRLRSGLKVRARHILGNDDDADDALQEAFYRLWSSKSDIRDVAIAEGTVSATVRNVSIDMCRRRVTHPTSGIESLPEIDSADEYVQDLGSVYSDVEQMIYQLLSVRDREILYKREMYGYDFDELAELYDITPENVRAIVSRSRKLIRERYKQLKTKR